MDIQETNNSEDNFKKKWKKRKRKRRKRKKL